MLSSAFHDGRLTSVIVADDTLVLDVLTEDKIFKIHLSGLKKLRVTDFKEGNIINAVREFCSTQLPDDTRAVRSLMMYAYDLDDADLERNGKFSLLLEKQIIEYESGSIVVLEIEPSYGAYLVAIGEKISEVPTPL